MVYLRSQVWILTWDYDINHLEFEITCCYSNSRRRVTCGCVWYWTEWCYRAVILVRSSCSHRVRPQSMSQKVRIPPTGKMVKKIFNNSKNKPPYIWSQYLQTFCFLKNDLELLEGPLVFFSFTFNLLLYIDRVPYFHQ